MNRAEPDQPLPEIMQGNWVEVDEPSYELIIDGREITCFGERVAFDFMEISQSDGALVVRLKVDDPAAEDAFHRENITGLVITPEGEFHVYNVKFAAQFVRAERAASNDPC